MNLHLGDCLEVLRTMPDNSVDSVVTDPPYGLSFMGKKWDYDVPSVDVWKECLRVLKPGGHALIACGTRTQHRMAVNIEDAGFEVRDVITWIYGSGFPKSLDISKAIDKAAGITEWKETTPNPAARPGNGIDATTSTGWAKPQRPPKPVVETDAAKQWAGYGTALKPACEFWTLARKPLEGTVANNVLKHGTGGLNIDGCRVGTEAIEKGRAGRAADQFSKNAYANGQGYAGHNAESGTSIGRFPANLILSDEAGALLDAQTGTLKSGGGDKSSEKMGYHGGAKGCAPRVCEPSQGGASRFFYCAKASKSERNAGLEGMPLVTRTDADGLKMSDPRMDKPQARNGNENFHPTVKPIALMRYLCRLITPPNGLVLDPFMGSGSTGVAAKLEGFRFSGIERDESYIEIAKRRCA